MLVERVEFVHHTGHSALRQTAVAFVDFPFGEYRCLAAAFRQMVGARQPGQTAADDDMIELLYFMGFHDTVPTILPEFSRRFLYSAL